MTTSRDREAALLQRCAEAGRGADDAAKDAIEANVFGLAATLVGSQFPNESANLLRSSEVFFEGHPTDRLSAEEMVRRGLVFGLPRFRDMLVRQLCGH